MCQEGAYGMALAGYRASEIIRKYYPGALIEKMREE
jgi:peptidoglycan hydrolase-like amidase